MVFTPNVDGMNGSNILWMRNFWGGWVHSRLTRIMHEHYAYPTQGCPDALLRLSRNVCTIRIRVKVRLGFIRHDDLHAPPINSC
jgi:hypothetical protein